MLSIYLWEIFVNLIENTIVAYLLFHRLTLRNPKYYIAMFTGFVLFSSILVSYCNFHQITSEKINLSRKQVRTTAARSSSALLCSILWAQNIVSSCNVNLPPINDCLRHFLPRHIIDSLNRCSRYLHLLCALLLRYFLQIN